MKKILTILFFLFFILTIVGCGKDANSFYTKALSMNQEKDNLGAIKELTKAIELSPNYIEAYQLRGSTKYFLKDYTEAFKDYNKVFKLNHSIELKFDHFSDLSDKFNNDILKVAIQDFAREIEIIPKNAELYLNRGIAKLLLYYNRDDPSLLSIKYFEGLEDDAIEDFSKAIEATPKDDWLYLLRGNVNRDKAIDDFTQAIAINSGNVEAYSMRAFEKYLIKDVVGAIADYKKAAELGDENAEKEITRIQEAEKRNKIQLAINKTNKRINDLIQQAKAKKKIKDYKGAIEYYTKAIALRPGESSYYHERGYCKYLIEDYKDAILDFTKASNLNPNNNYNYQWRGMAKAELEDYLGAIEDYTKAISLNPPKDKDIHYYWRGKAKENIKNPDGAIEDYTKAIYLNPEQPDYYYARGYLKNEKEDYKNAILDFTKAIELDPRDQFSYYRRGLAKEEIKDYRGALLDLKLAKAFGDGSLDEYMDFYIPRIEKKYYQ